MSTETQFGTWISTDIRLPMEQGYYLIQDGTNNVEQCYFYANHWGVRSNSCSKVTHWMPLPPPIKQE